VFSSGPAAGREIAITFDDGTCAACARRIIDYLLRSGERATIFPNGRYDRTWDPLAGKIRELVARGQLTVGNHTFHHVDAPAVGATAFGADLGLNERWIEHTFGLTARPFFRPPYGAYNAGTLVQAGRDGYGDAVMWSGTFADSSPRTIPYLLHAIRIWAKPGAIILGHANYPPTSEALAQIFAIVRSKHLRAVTIAQLLTSSRAR
jgi:peptidoglycan/xylan/chitin deacetylase (PgdA/CDA1 family)